MPETELLELFNAVKSHYTQQGYTVRITRYDGKYNIELRSGTEYYIVNGRNIPRSMLNVNAVISSIDKAITEIKQGRHNKTDKMHK